MPPESIIIDELRPLPTYSFTIKIIKYEFSYFMTQISKHLTRAQLHKPENPEFP